MYSNRYFWIRNISSLALNPLKMLSNLPEKRIKLLLLLAQLQTKNFIILIFYLLVKSRAISLPLFTALVTKSMQWSVTRESCSSACFFSESVFCFASHTSFKRTTNCFPLWLIALVRLKKIFFKFSILSLEKKKDHISKITITLTDKPFELLLVKVLSFS